MNFTLYKKHFLFILICIFLVFFYIFDLNNFLTIEYFKKNYLFFERLIQENYLISIFFFYLAWLFMLSVILPVSAVMIIFASFLFSPYVSIPISILIITIGGGLNFLLLKKIFVSRIFEKANFFIKKINMKFKDNEFQYLLLLRLIPIPYIIQNSIAVILKVNLRMFIITTVIGITPFVALYSLAGFKLKEIITKEGSIELNDLINYENFIIIGLLVIFIIISIILKKKLK
tara:strand:- start:68 stop:760 length:693 start_codon:yes stop_codon:yes gene_type:complete